MNQKIVNHGTSSPENESPQFRGALALQIGMHLQVRAARPDRRFLDLRFEQIIAGVPAVLRKVEDFPGVELRPESLQRATDCDAANPMHKRGVHKYSLLDYGLTKRKTCSNDSSPAASP